MEQRWDIFCRVIDNFGDAGVCWRLARQLHEEHDICVRLWIDDLDVLSRLSPQIHPNLAHQQVAGVEVRWWAEAVDAEPAEVVVEAFACELPTSYLAAMSRRNSPPVWINLEYLSAEDWVEGCHGLASPHVSLSLVKYFFFPGFGPGTGGLLREKDLFQRREALLHAAPRKEAIEISLFCYEHAAMGDLLEAWSEAGIAVLCRVPPGQPLAAVRRCLPGDGPWQRGGLRVEPVSFVSQAAYDRLLWTSDFNFVRGEDSFVRAQWAQRPFVWQAYRQADEVELQKLDAFLRRYLDGLPTPTQQVIERLFVAWVRGKQVGQHWGPYFAARHAIAEHNRKWAEQIAAAGDLAENLVQFAHSKL